MKIMGQKGLINKVFIVIFVTIFFYGIIIVLSDFDLVVEKTFEINFQYLPIIISLQVTSVFVGTIKFHRLLQKLKIPILFKESFKLFMLGRFMGITPGGTGIIIKSHILKKNYGKPISSTLPVLLIERWTEILAILIIVTCLLFWVDIYESKIILGIGYALFVISILVAYNKKSFLLFKKFSEKIKFLNRFATSLDESRDSLSILSNKRTFSEALGLSMITKVIQLTIVFLCFISVGIDLDYFTTGLIYYTALIAGVLTFIPAGMIVTESGMIALLLEFNVELVTATLGVFFVRIVTLWAGMVMGAITSRLVLKGKQK